MIFLYGIALLAGVASAVQPGQNAGLARSLARPLLAGAVSLGVSIAAIVAVMLATGLFGLPAQDRLAQVPWWAWLGGLMSAAIMAAQLYVSRAIGAATFLGLIVTAGVVTSILLDHFGLVGFKVHPAGLWRILGGALMIAGVGLVARF